VSFLFSFSLPLRKTKISDLRQVLHLDDVNRDEDRQATSSVDRMPILTETD
jgi:hypothetical protein